MDHITTEQKLSFQFQVHLEFHNDFHRGKVEALKIDRGTQPVWLSG